jgi:hypothetical protein
MRLYYAQLGIIVALIGAFPAAAAASVPSDQYQVISARNADAAFSSLDGCIETVAFVSSSDAIYGGRSGPVNKQGLTSVFLGRYDTCQPMVGKHYPAVFEGIAQTFDPLVSSPRLDRASISATMPITDDVSGAALSLQLDVSWELVGALQHDTSHSHVRLPGDGIVNSHENDLLGGAVAAGRFLVAGETIVLEPTLDAHLQLIKAGCQKLVSPHQQFDELACL